MAKEKDDEKSKIGIKALIIALLVLILVAVGIKLVSMNPKDMAPGKDLELNKIIAKV